MTKYQSNQEAKLYGLRYVQSYVHEINRFGEEDTALIDQILFLALLGRGGSRKKSQLGQDIFALAMNGFMRGGFFVEVGAHHASHLSNSWLLEREYGWRGILVEPNPETHESLRSERSAVLVDKCAWNRSGECLTFNATADPALSYVSGIEQYDRHDRSDFKSTDVESITSYC